MMTEPSVGQLACRETKFCPYAAVNKYPYKELHGEVSRVVSDNYFAHGAFHARGWTIYYVRTLLDTTEKPLLLIPEKEVQQFFETISRELDIYVTFPDITREPGFLLSFFGEGSPRPRYLGRLTNDCSMDDLQQAIPMEGSPAEEPEKLDEDTLPMFRRHMQLALQASEQKSKAVRDKKKKERIDLKRQRCAELKRAQCYLGLRRRGSINPRDYDSDHNMSFEETQRIQEAYEIAAGITLPPLDVSVSAPYLFDRNTVFVCVDIEVYEKNHHSLTEIGVTTLDTLDLNNIPLGEGAHNWMKRLRPRHFRIAENSHLKNTEFVAGCADRFEFGTSEWISIQEVPYVLASCFTVPFSEPGKYLPYPTNIRQMLRGGSKLPPLVKDNPDVKRNIVLVGHNIEADIDYMRKAGYDVGNLPNVVEAIDTATLFRAFKYETNPRSLGAVLLDLGLTGWNLHNAGNDAYYTMQALLSTCIAARVPVNKPPIELSPEELEETAASARERVKEDYEEWRVADEEGTDGGDPVALLPAAEALANAEFDRAMRKGRKADERKRVQREKGWGRGTSGGQRYGGHSRNAFSGSGREPKPELTVQATLDEDAMDEAMGFSSAATASWGGANDVRAPGENATMPLVNERKMPEEYGPAYKKAGYVPPHLQKARQATGKSAAEVFESHKSVQDMSEEMVARLRMLDD